MSVSSRPLLLVLGPSGAGKSTLAAALSTQKGWLHIELDQWPEDGVENAGLRAECDSFFLRYEPAGLFHEFSKRLITGNHPGGVLSMPSVFVMPAPLIEIAHRYGFSTVVLYGSAADCLNAFLRRESVTGRGFTADHWNTYNINCHDMHGWPEYAPYRIDAFRMGIHRPMDELLTEVIARGGL